MPMANNGIYIGEGLPPVPLKLAERIRRWNFVDMSELLSELWSPATAGKPDDGSSDLQQPLFVGGGRSLI